MNEENTVLTLNDNKKYVIVDNETYENNEYMILSEVENPVNIFVGKVNGNMITKITDEYLIGKIILMFNEKKEN